MAKGAHQAHHKMSNSPINSTTAPRTPKSDRPVAQPTAKGSDANQPSARQHEYTTSNPGKPGGN